MTKGAWHNHLKTLTWPVFVSSTDNDFIFCRTHMSAITLLFNLKSFNFRAYAYTMRQKRGTVTNNS